MNGRTVLALRCAGGLALIAAWALWWAPTALFLVAKLAAGRARFGLVMAIGDGLKVVGRRDSAARLYEREAKRCRARMAEMRARRGW